MSDYRDQNGAVIKYVGSDSIDGERYFWLEFPSGGVGQIPVVDVKQRVASGDWEPID